MNVKDADDGVCHALKAWGDSIRRMCWTIPIPIVGEVIPHSFIRRYHLGLLRLSR